MWSQRVRHGWATFTFTLFSLSWGFWKRALCQDLPLYLRASTLIPICWREGERERIPPTTSHIPPTQTTNPNSQQNFLRPYIPDGPLSCFIQTPSRSSLSSPQLPPGFLNSQPIVLWPPYIWNLLFKSPTPPDSKSTNNYLWTHLLICTNRPVLHQISTLSPPLFTCCSLSVSSACLLSQLSL